MRAAALPLLVLLSLSACPKKDESKPAPAAKGGSSTAEVEFLGKWSPGGVQAAKVVFVAQVEPCLPVPEKPTRYGEQKLDVPGNLFAEFFPDQGSKGHACVYAYDASGKVVGAASTAQNPMTFEGKGEVVKSDLSFELQPVP